jgi:transcriptional regulator with GAF, ATPase, and Fis domain
LEGELFGYAKGAFTGAVHETPGFLEDDDVLHTVFLDEIGECDTEIQVKLLRVLQSGEFHRLGDRTLRRFSGKIITATNRCLPQEIQNERFRADLYYRLCADIVETPSLRVQLDDTPSELYPLLESAAGKLVGLDESAAVARQAARWIEEKLPPRYPWPGNMRELEQCVRSIVVNGAYAPPALCEPKGDASLQSKMEAASLTADELLSEYCKMVFAKTQNYVQTGRLLGLDRRTVKARVESG